MSRNLINAEALKEHFKSFAFEPHIEKWFLTTYLRDLANANEAVQCVSAKDARAPVFRMLTKLTGEDFHVISHTDSVFEEAGLRNYDLWLYDIENVDEQYINHIADFFRAKLGKSIRMSVEQMEAGLAEWDRQLRLEEICGDTTYKMELAALDLGAGYYGVKLGSKSAYQLEGKVMRHCVASYWGRACQIYSLRRLMEGEDKAEPRECLTVEVRDKKIFQVRGYDDGRASIDEAYDALREFAVQMDFELKPVTVQGWPRALVTAADRRASPDVGKQSWMKEDDLEEEEGMEQHEDEDDSW